MKQTFLILLFASLSTIGCASGGAVYYAATPPPPVRVEAYGPAPGAGFVWINGY